MEIDQNELRTETFTNARGWTAIRVTHAPTGTVVERARSDALRSAVQAQRECVDELRRRLSSGRTATEPPPADGNGRGDDGSSWVTRRELDALASRVEMLERLAGLDPRS